MNAMKRISRRTFLGTSVAGSIGFGMSGPDSRHWAIDTQFVPALIVGSGFGGAVAALRLALAAFATFEKAERRLEHILTRDVFKA